MPRMDSSGGTPIAGGAGTGVTNGATYTWHLSLRLDRPVEVRSFENSLPAISICACNTKGFWKEGGR